jgi:hypothetical protein
MNYLVCECGYEDPILNDEVFPSELSEERCPDCGKVGTLKEEYR